MENSDYKARYWHLLEDGRMQCDLCPRDCKLHEGQRGACFVRMRQGDEMILTTYGRSSGFCIDPIEKNHSITSIQAPVCFHLVLQGVISPVSLSKLGCKQVKGYGQNDGSGFP